MRDAGDAAAVAARLDLLAAVVAPRRGARSELTMRPAVIGRWTSFVFVATSRLPAVYIRAPVRRTCLVAGAAARASPHSRAPSQQLAAVASQAGLPTSRCLPRLQGVPSVTIESVLRQPSGQDVGDLQIVHIGK